MFRCALVFTFFLPLLLHGQGFAQLPLSFEPGASPGQYIAHRAGDSATLAAEGVTIHTTHMRFAGASASPGQPIEALQGRLNYLRGADPRQWRVNVPTFAKVRFANVYPGIDVVYSGHEGNLEYDFVLAPGADPAAIRLAFDRGVDPVIQADGDLVTGDVRHLRPVAYQEVDGTRKLVTASYRRERHGTVGFRIGHYDRTQPLVIDPTLVYSQTFGAAASYFGGNLSYSPVADMGKAVALDGAGNTYVLGNSVNGFSLAGAGSGSFVLKLNPAGNTLLYVTYVSGFASAMAVDAAGNVYLTGSASSSFPTTSGAFQTGFGGTRPVCYTGQGGDAYVMKLNASGSQIGYATFLGGSGCDAATSISVDSSGHAYVGGVTDSVDFPVKNGINNSAHGGLCTVNGQTSQPCITGFVAELDPQGASLIYSTYLGGSGMDSVNGITVDSSGNAYVAGNTASTDFPVTAGALQTHPGPIGCTQGHGFVTKLAAQGAALAYSTFLGGVGCDGVYAIAVDAAGSAYAAGQTSSLNFPTTTGAFQTTAVTGLLGSPPLPFAGHAFVSKLNPSGTALAYSTYIAGSNTEQAWAMAVDSSGNAYVLGTSASPDLPLVQPVETVLAAPCAYQFTCRGVVFLAVVNPTGHSLVYSTELGDIGESFAGGVAADASGNAYATGTAFYGVPAFGPFVSRFPQVGTQVQQSPGTIFLVKIAPGGTSTPLDPDLNNLHVSSLGNSQTATAETTLAQPISITVTDSSGNPVARANVQWFLLSGGGTLAGSSQTDSNGNVSASWTLGSPVGAQSAAVVVTQDTSHGTFFNFTATAVAGSITPAVPSNGVVNAAGFTQSPAAISPGAIVSLFGTNLSNAPSTGLNAQGSALPATLGATQVTFAGAPAPLFYVSPSQLNVQVPWALVGWPTGSVPVQVTVGGVPSATVNVPFAALDPGIFVTANGNGAAAALNQDLSANSAANPAARGSVMAFFITGLDLAGVTALTESGYPPATSLRCATQPQVAVGGVASSIQYCGPAPNYVGLWQVNVPIPAATAAGQVTVAMTVGGLAANPVTVFVK